MLAAAMLLGGTARLAFLALGLTLPGLMLQDSWRYSFFALGRGSQAFLNDTIWAVALLPALVLLRMTGHANVFWFVFAWGAAAAVGAAVGPLQARVMPRMPRAWDWVSQHRDLGPRYLAEGTANSASTQLRNYGAGIPAGPGGGRLRPGRQHADGSLHGHLLRHGPGHPAGGGPDPASFTTASAAVLRARERRTRPARPRLGSRAAGGHAERTRATACSAACGGRRTRSCCPARSPSWAAASGRRRHRPARSGRRTAEPARHGARLGALYRPRPGGRRRSAGWRGR